MVDHDGNPETPPVLARKSLVVTAAAITIAVASTVALVVVLVV